MQLTFVKAGLCLGHFFVGFHLVVMAVLWEPRYLADKFTIGIHDDVANSIANSELGN